LASSHHSSSDVEFVGVDGEGVTRPDGKHEYNLLSVGSRSLYFDDGRELTWYDIIPFLWECFLERPEAIYVGFYLGYDFTQWLKHLPENRARMLLTDAGIASRQRSKSGGNHTPFSVEHHGWEFDFLGLKRFRLWETSSDKRFYLCDTGAYFQTSFLNAIDPLKWPDGAILSDSEFKQIQRGKEERGVSVVEYGTPIDLDTIAYNHLENRVLARLMRKYNEGLTDIGVRLKRNQWFGPGQAAQSWLNSIRAPTREQFEDASTPEVRSACRSSYYGGWFENFAHGHIPGTSHSYDLNSAYPDIQSRLPCTLHGTWEMRSDHMQSGDFVLVYGTVSGTNEYIGAAPHRLRSGHILRPNRTKGWYWKHEIEAATNAGLVSSVDVERSLSYLPCDCPPPFWAERRLYEERLKVGKNTINGKARKLVYNSAYGKTAQSIGLAKYANPFYASYITSMCRTFILRAIAHHEFGPSDVLMVATDGITFRRRNIHLALSETVLGQWSETANSNLTLFMPGVYWDDATRHKLAEGAHPTLKSRGISAVSLAKRIAEIDALFHDAYSGNGFPVLDLPINFSMVSPKQALARGKWNTCGLISTDGFRRIDSDPTNKRNPLTAHIVDNVIRTNCYPMGHTLETTPYKKTFGSLDSELSEDGEMTMLLASALGDD